MTMSKHVDARLSSPPSLSNRDAVGWGSKKYKTNTLKRRSGTFMKHKTLNYVFASIVMIMIWSLPSCFEPVEIPGFGFWANKYYSCGGQTNSIMRYHHVDTGLTFALVPGNDKVEPFLICQTEVTQRAWRKIMASSPWKGKDNVREGYDYPATYISWDDCIKFCERTGFGLPSKTEWKYACRAGILNDFCFGDSISDLGDFAWFKNNASDTNEKYPHCVGQKKPNAFGLYDIHGNVNEWCLDDDKDKPNLRYKMGGDWEAKPEHCYSGYMSLESSNTKSSFIGFRPVCSAQGIIYQGIIYNSRATILLTDEEIDYSNPKGFIYLRDETFSCGVKSNVVKIFEHNMTGLEFVLIPKCENIESFLLCRTEINQGVWKRIMETEPWYGEENTRENDQGAASYICWNDCKEFCKKSQLRFPSELEWEYACRAGTTTNFCFGDSASELDAYAWYSINTLEKGEDFPHPVGLKKPNAFGLYDIHGNVREWCLTKWYENDYIVRPINDPSWKPEGVFFGQVVRGGGWPSSNSYCFSSYRNWHVPGRRQGALGFRPACSRK